MLISSARTGFYACTQLVRGNFRNRLYHRYPVERRVCTLRYFSSGGFWDRILPSRERAEQEEEPVMEPLAEKQLADNDQEILHGNKNIDWEKQDKKAAKAKKSRAMFRELQRTVGVRSSVNLSLEPLRRGTEFPSASFPVVVRSLAGSNLQLKDAITQADATVVFVSANNAVSQPTVTNFHNMLCDYFANRPHGVVQSFEFSLGSIGFLRQAMIPMLEGFLRNGTPEERQAHTAFIAKDTPRLKTILGMDDMLIGFWYVCDRNGNVRQSGRCDSEKYELMLSMVEDTINATSKGDEGISDSKIVTTGVSRKSDLIKDESIASLKRQASQAVRSKSAK